MERDCELLSSAIVLSGMSPSHELRAVLFDVEREERVFGTIAEVEESSRERAHYISYFPSATARTMQKDKAYLIGFYLKVPDGEQRPNVVYSEIDGVVYNSPLSNDTNVRIGDLDVNRYEAPIFQDNIVPYIQVECRFEESCSREPVPLTPAPVPVGGPDGKPPDEVDDEDGGGFPWLKIGIAAVIIILALFAFCKVCNNSGKGSATATQTPKSDIEQGRGYERVQYEDPDFDHRRGDRHRDD